MLERAGEGVQRRGALWHPPFSAREVGLLRLAFACAVESDSRAGASSRREAATAARAVTSGVPKEDGGGVLAGMNRCFGTGAVCMGSGVAGPCAPSSLDGGVAGRTISADDVDSGGGAIAPPAIIVSTADRL